MGRPMKACFQRGRWQMFELGAAELGSRFPCAAILPWTALSFESASPARPCGSVRVAGFSFWRWSFRMHMRCGVHDIVSALSSTLRFLRYPGPIGVFTA